MTTPTDRPRLLQLGRLPPFLEGPLAEGYDLHRLADEADPAAFLARHGASFTGAVTSAGVGLDAPTLAALPALRVVSSMGVGLDRLDLPSLAARGVAVGYTPDVLNDCVADTAMALVLAVARRVVEADRFVRAGRWAAGDGFGLGRRVSGAKLGIVGLGRIGRTIARRAGGFDMAIRYHSRRPVAGVDWPHEPSLAALADWCDFLVVITAGGAETRHLVNAEVLDALGPRGFLVNVARGSVVDEAALVRALAERRIAGAGLDVFEDEPRVPEALFSLDNVVLLPHVASATDETRRAMAQRVLDNLAGFYRDGRLVSAAS
ncbi:2-hydroxyacid dehydrogenase [Aquabacterium sp. J223]|uniref:2-hydroxyacid dehydrogenase n=1 Tax=Aquabacterium sp. J223 TaxID=2898431 RepID=UPI0021ADFAAD|nr:2-hydroxyacid dehydrogenase [Aquabacterium sp. J223]UUX97134.1 2-hydroxyacid dehydrogenase [Aquabacterium sp. J223]